MIYEFDPADIMYSYMYPAMVRTFRTAGFPMEEMARRYPVAGDGSDRMEKWHLDLWQANRGLLEDCCVPSARIHLAGVCTYGHSERFFSARRLGIRSGRILNGIFLTD